MRSWPATLAPCTHTLGLTVRLVSAVLNAGMSSLTTITCFGWTIDTECVSAVPVRLVLISATTPPIRVMPSQIAIYSGRLSIIRQTTSPFFRPWASAQRA